MELKTHNTRLFLRQYSQSIHSVNRIDDVAHVVTQSLGELQHHELRADKHDIPFLIHALLVNH